MQTFTAMDIARHIARNGEDLELVTDRIRNWTKDGLLEPTGAKNPGSGRTRVYPEDALIDAMVLRELMDGDGVQPGKAYSYASTFRDFKKSQGKNFRQKRFLVFCRSSDELDDPRVLMADPKDLVQLGTAPWTSFVVINLAYLYVQLNKAERS